MLQTAIEVIEGGRGRRVRLAWSGTELSFGAVATRRQEPAFADAFVTVMAGAPFDAFFWETPPVTVTTCERVFEFVWIDAPALERLGPDRDAFAQHFDGNAVATFPSLGGDAVLVAPRFDAQARDESHYVHLAAFSRHAPRAQQIALWRAVGEAFGRRLGAAPLWLSTSGLGVGWLHVRLDSQPKYYAHAPYRTHRGGRG